MATIVKQGGSFFTKDQNGLMAISDPVQLRDLYTGRTPYTDEAYSTSTKYATPNVSAPTSQLNVPLTPQPQDTGGSPYDKFNLSLMQMLKEAQTQNADMSSNKQLANLQSQQAVQGYAPLPTDFYGASPSQIESVRQSKMNVFRPDIAETSAVIQAKTQKINQFNDLVTQARAIGEDFAKNLVPDEATLQNYADLIEADPSKMATILSAAGNDKTRQKIMGMIDLTKLVAQKEIKAPEVKTINGVDMMWNGSTGKWEAIAGTPGTTTDAEKQRLEALTLAKELRSNLASGKAGAVGFGFQKLVPYGRDIGLQPDRVAFEANLARLKANLTKDNLKMLKGAMSDKDLLFLEAIASSLDTNMSEEAFNKELDRIILKLGGTVESTGSDDELLSNFGL